MKLRKVPEKGKLLERAGRKITGLKPLGQGSGIAEEDHPLVNSENPHRKARSVALGTRKARERLTGSQGFEAFPNHMAKRSGRMKDLFTKVKSFIQEEDGASAVEYGLLVAGIAVVVMTAIYLIGTNLNAKFQAVATQIG